MIMMLSPKQSAKKKPVEQSKKAEQPAEGKQTVEVKGAKAEPERDITETNPLAAALKDAGLK